jgi:peptidoglycan/LPS O-acetylase OafA/YrhL
MEIKATQRRYDLDWLRVLAFSGVFLYHCSRFFNSNDWEMKNAETSTVVDVFTGIFDLWGMPLLFVISGASIFLALRPGGALRFLRDRVLRLLVPLAIGIVVLAPPQLYLEALTKGQFQGSFLQYLAVYFHGHIVWSGVHLWYLKSLFVITVLLLPVFVWLKRPSGQAVLAGLSRFSLRPGVIFLWALPFAASLVVLDPYGILRPAPSEEFLRITVYILFPLYGYLVFAERGIQQAIVGQRRVALIVALALTPIAALTPAAVEQSGWQLTFPSLVMMMSVGGLLIWSYVVALLGYSMRYLTTNRPLLAYANQAVLPFYILHHPVILFIGYFVIPLALPIAVKYLFITALAFGITLGLYEYGVRRVNLLRWLFGLKPRKNETTSIVRTGSSLRPA